MNAPMLSPLIAPPASLLGGLLLAFLIARLGRGAFPIRLFGASIAIGLVMGVCILFVESPFDLKANQHGFSKLAISFLFAGFPEEAAKIAGAFFFVRPHYLRRSSRDLVLGAASVALGFALLENLLYVQGAGAHWGRLAFARAITAVPFHVLLGLIAGRALALAELSADKIRAVARVAATWIVVASLHGLYDFALLSLAAGPPFPDIVTALASRGHIAPAPLLLIALLGALFAICALACAAPRNLDLAPFRAGPVANATRMRRFDRFVLARATGYVIAALLIVASLLALALVGAFAFIVDQPDALYAAAAAVACPVAIAAMLLAYPVPHSASAASRAQRYGFAYAALAILALALYAAFRWGDGPARQVLAIRIELRGVQLASKGDTEGALREFDRAIATDPTLVDARLKRAGALYQQGKQDQALSDLDDAVLMQPNNAELLKMRAQLQRELNRPLAAIADLDRALTLNPIDPELWANRAQAYSEANMPDKARADLARAEDLGPHLSATLMTRALLAVREADYDRAISALDEDLQSRPDDVDQLFFRGRIHFYRRDADSAVADLQTASSKAKVLYPAIWLYLQRARDGADGGPELSAAALRVNQYKWPFPVVKFLLGQISASQMREAAETADQRCEADFYYGEWLLGQGKTPAALDSLRAAASECPTGFIEYEGARAELQRL